MNQTIRLKRNNQKVPCFKPDYLTNIPSKRDSKTPQLYRVSPQNKFKKKKTPIKSCMNQKIIQKSEIPIKDKSIKSLNINGCHQQTLSEIGQKQIPHLKCKQCEDYQKRQKQLLQRLKQHQLHQREFQFKFQQLKQEYEKKLKKYKVKSRIQKDELKLLKWILSERKEFHQILQKLQKMKEKGIRPLDQDFGQQNLNQQEICLTDRTIPKHSPKQKVQTQKEQKVKSQKINIIETKTLPIQVFQKNPKNQVIKVPTQREVQMFNHINVLQQKLMQLTIRNDFLEKIKLKQNQENKPKTYSNESISFTKDFMIPKEENKISSQRFYWQQDQMNNYQYSDDDQIYGRQSNKRNFSAENQLFNSLKRRKFEVESRYIFPLKERINDSNKKQTQIKFQKKQQKNSDVVPQNRSKYYDSIKERSRLLGI